MKNLRLLVLATILPSLLMSFMLISDTNGSQTDQSCQLTVLHNNGSAAKYVDVSTDVSGGLSCSGGRTFETNRDGQVTLFWVKGCYLKKIFVKGKGYTVDYRDGGRYTITIP